MKSLAELRRINIKLKELKRKAKQHGTLNESMERVKLEKENRELLSILNAGVKVSNINEFAQRDLLSGLSEIRSSMSNISY